jgi:MFS family permease
MRETPGRTPSTAYAWYVVGVLTLANISANVDQYILSLLVGPIKRDLGISDAQVGLLLGLAFSLFYAVLGLPIARLADRANRRNLIAGGIALWSVFTSLCAMARTYATLLLCRVGVGVGEATLGAPSVSLLADYFPRERRSRALSIYSFGIYLGAGSAYFVGAMIVGVVAATGTYTVPVFGTIRPWQSVFIAVGLPGLLVAALLFTVREPLRRTLEQQLPVSALIAYIKANRRTYIAHSFGFAASGLVNSALALWLATFFIRTYGLTAPQAGKVQGLLTMSIGTVGVLSGGWVADWYVKRGQVDGPLRVGMIGAAGMLVSASLMPLMPSATLAIAWLAVVNFFAAFPWGAAPAAAAEMVPSSLRAQGVALFFFTKAIISQTLGPTVVGLLNDHVFSEKGIRYSLVTLNVVAMAMAIAILGSGLGAYRRTVERRDAWAENAEAARVA